MCINVSQLGPDRVLPLPKRRCDLSDPETAELSDIRKRCGCSTRGLRTTIVRSQDPNRSGSRNDCSRASACRNASAAASSAEANSPVTPKAAARAARQYRENSSPIAAPSPCRASSTSSRSACSFISLSKCGYRRHLFAGKRPSARGTDPRRRSEGAQRARVRTLHCRRGAWKQPL